MPISIRPFALLALLLIIPVSSFALAENRLDPNVSPTSQTVYLDLDATRTEYSGNVNILLDVKKATKTFRFHAEEMTIDRITLRGKNDPMDIEFEVKAEGLVLARTKKKIKPGSYTLAVEFHKDYNTRAVGLYRMEQDGVGYLFTQFEAVDARKAFPCWDEPSYKIPFQVTVRVPQDQEAVSNTPIESDTRSDGFKTLVYAKTKPLPTYLLAFAVGPLDYIEIPGLSVPGRIYTTKGQSHLAHAAAEYSPPILKALEEYFGRPYPYRKLDLIAIPEYWPGAMENPGAVTYAAAILLIDSKTASINQRRRLAHVTSHEFAHMWFGDLVTMAWWDDLWLNESFADWLAFKITDQLYPDYKAGVSELSEVQELLSQDARPSTRPVRKPVTQTSDIFEDLFVAYAKGRQVLAMTEQWIGEDAFRNGVVSYINKHEWGNTEANDLFSALSEASGTDMTPMLSSFLDQSGYPMISAEVENGTLTLRQKRFLNHGITAADQHWIVPMNIKYFDGKTVRTESVLLDQSEMHIPIDGDIAWMVPDASAYGYYRWRVPESMLLRVASDPEGKLDERERAVFMANLKALLYSGDIHGDEYMRLLSAYAGVAKPEIIDAVMDELGSIQAAFVTKDLEPAFGHYVSQTLDPAYQEFGLRKQEREAPAVSAVRPRMIRWLGQMGNNVDVKAHCQQLVEAYIEDPTSVDPTMARSALRVVARTGTRENYDVFKSRFEAAASPNERRAYLGAIGSFGDAEIITDALQYALSDAVRPTEIFGITGMRAGNLEAERVVFEWLLENYDAIAKRIPPDYIAYMPYVAGGCLEERLAAAKAFFDKEAYQVDGTLKNLAKVEEQVVDCVNLRSRDGHRVEAYLKGLVAQ